MAGVAPVVPPAELPLLVTHGGFVWWVLWILTGAIGLAVAFEVASRRARRWRRARLADLGRRVARVDALGAGQHVVLRGTLVGESGAAAVGLRHAGRGRRDPVDGPARPHPLLALELDDARDGEGAGTRVALDGPIRVTVGREVVAARGRSRALEQAYAGDGGAAAAGEPPVDVSATELHRVTVGSRVLVAGEVAVTAAREHGAGYRDAARAWTLIGSAASPIELACETGGLPRPWQGSRWQLGLIVGLAVGIASLSSVGQVLLRLGGGGHPDEGPVELSPFEPLVIAAALPGSRGGALERLHGELVNHAYRDGPSVARIAALSGLARGCAAASEAWLLHRQPELAAAQAESCSTRAAAIEPLIELGDYRAAADAAAAELRAGRVPGQPALVALISARRWSDAARAVHVAYLHGHGHGNGRALRADSARAFECLALHLEHRAGDADALAALARLAREPDGWQCGPLYADLLSGQELRDLVVTWRISRPRSEEHGDLKVDKVMGLLVGFGGGGLADWQTGADHAVLTALAQPMETARVNGLALRLARPLQRALAQLPPPPDADERAMETLQVLDLTLSGLEDPAEALRRLDRARLGSFWRQALEVALRLRLGERLSAEPGLLLADTVNLRAGRALPEGGARQEDLRAAAGAAAQTGDGARLASHLQEHRYQWGVDQLLFAIAPTVREGRAELAQYLAWRGHSLRARRDPCDHLVDAALRRDMFAWLGDAARSKRWAATARGHLGPCTDREAAVALWMVTDRLPLIHPRFAQGAE